MIVPSEHTRVYLAVGATDMRKQIDALAALVEDVLTLEAVAQGTMLAVPTSYLALLCVLSAIAVLAVTFLASLLPGTAKRLSECQH